MTSSWSFIFQKSSVFSLKLEAAVCSEVWTQNSWYLPDDGGYVSAHKYQNVRRHISLNVRCSISPSSAILLQKSAPHEPRDSAATSPTLLFSRKSKQISEGAVPRMLCVRAAGNFQRTSFTPRSVLRQAVSLFQKHVLHTVRHT